MLNMDYSKDESLSIAEEQAVELYTNEDVYVYG